MVEKTAENSPSIDYSRIDIYVEEAENMENHYPAMIVEFPSKRIRIIPSVRWPKNPAYRLITGLLSHETIHLAIAKLEGVEASLALDRVPQPKNWKEFRTGVFGYGRRN